MNTATFLRTGTNRELITCGMRNVFLLVSVSPMPLRLCFLMPATSLRRQYFDVTNSRGDFQVADLCRLANFYAVSVQAIALRLESLSLVRKGTWDTLSEQGFKPETAKHQLKLQPLETALWKQYPARYEFLALLAFSEDKLSEGELATYLRTDRVTVRKVVRDCIVRSDDVDANGDVAVLRVALGGFIADVFLKLDRHG